MDITERWLYYAHTISASGGRDTTTYTVDVDMMTNIYSYTIKSKTYGPEITDRQLAYSPEFTLETA